MTPGVLEAETEEEEEREALLLGVALALEVEVALPPPRLPPLPVAVEERDWEAVARGLPVPPALRVCVGAAAWLLVCVTEGPRPWENVAEKERLCVSRAVVEGGAEAVGGRVVRAVCVALGVEDRVAVGEEETLGEALGLPL